MPHESIPFLRTHSYYGFLESLLSPEELVHAAAKNGIATLGLTDHRYLTGAVSFFEACDQSEIKPIIGLEIDLNYYDYHGRLALLATDQAGWSNLCRLSTLLLRTKGDLDINTLISHQNGLVCIAGGPQGVLRNLIVNSPEPQKLPEQLINDLGNCYLENFFIEVQRFANGPLKNETTLVSLAKKHDVTIIAAQNVHYSHPKDHAIYRTLTAIKHNGAIHELSRNQLPPGSAHFPTCEDFANRFQDIPETLENLKIIQDQCNFRLPFGKTHYPAFATPKGESQSSYLKKRAYKGAHQIYNELTPEITQRLNYELEIISGMGYEPIFLIVEDVINQARKLGIPTSSRGSAASSLVAHCLNITSPDPLALNLYFERFLNPARKKPPDIDIDIASHRRDEVIQYVFDAYGKDRVAMVGTINRYRPKSAFGDVAKAYGLSAETIRQLSKRLPSSFRFNHGDQKDPFASLVRNGSISAITNIINDARAILDMPRHLSIHPGGIIIAPFTMTDLIPLSYSPTFGINHTQFDLAGVEKLGMVKIDLLSIKGLTVLAKVADRIQSWKSNEFINGLDVLENIPNNDTETSEIISSAKTIGCFQIESPGMRATLQEINAKKIEDIMAALALYRPGPLRGGLRDAFISRFRGEEPVSHIHVSLAGLLEDTLGVILYQEQVLRIASEIGGLSIAQADILRRAMSHFDPGREMESLQKIFLEGALDHQNIPLKTAERIWEMMAAFAGYGFPKAHAASYAKLAWNSAWCKTHFPAEFIAAVLGFGGGYYSQRVYLMEAQRLGLRINPPHINHSNPRFSVRYPDGSPELYVGFNNIRDLSQQTIKAIMKKRPFNTLEDFLIRVDPNKHEAQNLILCDAFNGLTTIPQGLDCIAHDQPPGQMQLFAAAKPSDDWSSDQKTRAQKEILGLSLAISPLEQYADQIQSCGAITTIEAQRMIGEKIIVAGMRQTLRRNKNQKNQMMGYLTLEDLEGSLQVVIPPQIYNRHHVKLKDSGPFLIEGIVHKKPNHQRIRITAEKIVLLK